MGRITDIISNIRAGDEKSSSKDVLGSVYEYFLSRFTNYEGKEGGKFYTPQSVVRLPIQMLQPHNGRIYDPCCGTAGMPAQSVTFIRPHAKGNGSRFRSVADMSIYGQESDHATWQLAKMNLAIHGIDGSRIVHGDIFHNDQRPDLKADYTLANPPFDASEWGGERLQDDQRWAYKIPPKANANFAWVQHVVHHLAPFGTAGLVLASG